MQFSRGSATNSDISYDCVPVCASIYMHVLMCVSAVFVCMCVCVCEHALESSFLYVHICQYGLSFQSPSEGRTSYVLHGYPSSLISY